MVFNVVIPLFSSQEFLEGDGGVSGLRNGFDKHPICDVLCRNSLLCPARGDAGLRSEHKGLHIFDTARGPPSNLAWAGSRPIFDDCGNHIERQRLADGRRWLWVVAFSSQRASTYPRGDNYIHRFDHRIPVVGVKSV